MTGHDQRRPVMTSSLKMTGHDQRPAAHKLAAAHKLNYETSADYEMPADYETFLFTEPRHSLNATASKFDPIHDNWTYFRERLWISPP